MFLTTDYADTHGLYFFVLETMVKRLCLHIPFCTQKQIEGFTAATMIYDSMELRKAIQENASDLCGQYGIRRLCIFGSVARGEETEDSDIDFLAEFDSPTPETMPDRYFGFINSATKVFKRPVQLMTLPMMRNPHLIRSVEKDLLVVHE